MSKICNFHSILLPAVLGGVFFSTQPAFAACDLPMFAGARLFSASASPMFIATGDFNRDGHTDVAVSSGSGLSVLLGNGDGTFRPPVKFTFPNLNDVVVGDFNGDGNPDLAFNANYSTMVMLGNGDGTFQTPIVGNSTGGGLMAVGDFNNDGKLDIALLATPATVMLGNGDGTFQKPPFNPNDVQASFALAVGDFNRDGNLDVVVALSGGVGIMLGDGKGNLADAVSYGTGNSGAAPMQLGVGDLNGDGKLDVLALSPLDSNVYELSGNGDGTLLAAVAIPVGNLAGLATAMLEGDFNGDSKLDFAVANSPGVGTNGVISVFYGNGDGTFQPQVQYNPTGQINSALALGDFNGDGLADIVFTSEVTSLPTQVGVMFGGSNGKLQSPNNYPVGPTPTAPAIADFNGDGIPDMAVVGTGFSGNLSVMLGNGDGTFQAATSYATAFGSRAVVAGDFNGDGKIDLAVANGTASNILVFMGNGDGTFQSSISGAGVFGGASFLAVGDFNKDGIPDLAVSGVLGVGIYIGNGDGTFRSPGLSISLSPPQGQIVVADLNGDGNLDVVVAYSTVNGFSFQQNAGNISVMLGNGDGTLRPATSYTAGTQATSVAVGDLNNDGRPDLAVADFGTGNVVVLSGNGDGTFQTPVSYPSLVGGNSIVMNDFDGDGNLDVAIASNGGAGGFSQTGPNGLLTVMLGKGDGTFQNAMIYGAGSDATALTSADLNGDGQPDLVVPDQVANTVVVLLNSFIKGSTAAVCTAVPAAGN